MVPGELSTVTRAVLLWLLALASSFRDETDMRIMTSALALHAMAAMCACFLSGCNRDAGPSLTPVTGTVTVDGEPFPQASVSFRPDKEKGNNFGGYIPAGYTDDSGKYELMTTARKGAPVGWYKVVITPPTAPPGGEMPKVEIPPFNPKYADPEKTDLSIEVVEGAPPGAYDLELTK
jgi:hypothetical protein